MAGTPENKVKFGLNNVHIALQTETVDDTTGTVTYTYDTPHRLIGAVNLTQNAQGGLTPFYADDRQFYVTFANNGYTGDLEIARITDWFRENVLNEKPVTSGGGVAAHLEKADEIPASFALLFEFQGDRQKRRWCLYNCTVSRPNITGATTTDTITPQTDTLTLTASPRADMAVKAWAGPDDGAFDQWFSTVWQPSA